MTDEELQAYYEANEYRLTLPEQVRVRHILLSWKPLGKPDDRAALYDLMRPILEEARAGADFAEAFFLIWLGSDPPNAGLKRGLLGRCSLLLQPLRLLALALLAGGGAVAPQPRPIPDGRGAGGARAPAG